MVELIKELTNAGASIAAIIVLAYLLLQFIKQSREQQKALDANTEVSRQNIEVTKELKDAVGGLKDVIGGCKYNRSKNA